jgi:type III restriction enzyme
VVPERERPHPGHSHHRREDAKEKKATMDTYWVPGVNHLGTYGRWAFSELTEIYQIESDFKAKVESEFDKMIASATVQPATGNK